MSYTNNPLAIIAGAGITVTPTTGTGANSVTISASGSQKLTVRSCTATPVTVTDTDDVLSIEVPGSVPVEVDLPAGVLGRVFTIKDALGLASATADITIYPDGTDTIDGTTAAVINVPYGSVTVIFNGTTWLIT